MLPLAACLILNIHLEETTDFPSGLGTTFQTSFFIMDWYSSVMASFQVVCLIASETLVGFDLHKSFMFAAYLENLLGLLLSLNVLDGPAKFCASSTVLMAQSGIFLEF